MIIPKYVHKILLFCLITLLLSVFIGLHATSLTAHSNYTLGDVNSDTEVDSADAIWLLRHTLFPCRYIINQPADFNNDGKEDSADAIWLLRHTLFPSRYALHTPVYYSITWKNYDGSVLATTSAALGSTPVYDGSTPAREGTDQIAYTFTGWSPAVSAANEDAEYTAQFEQGARKYAVTWINYDGTILKTDNVEFGTTPSYSGTTPQRSSDAVNNYSFKGWSPSIEKIQRDVTYIAQYDLNQRNSFTIKYDANGGSGAPSSQTKSKGSSITLSTVVPKNGDHVFMGWACGNDGRIYSAGSTFSIDADATLYAVWGHVCDNCHGEGVSAICSTCSGKGTVKGNNLVTGSCPTCNGKGKVYSYENCSWCGGSGKIYTYTCSYGDYIGIERTPHVGACPKCGRWSLKESVSSCSTCGGSGKITKSSNCSKCNGTGRYSYYPDVTCSACNGLGKIRCSVCNGNKQIKDYTTAYTITLKDGTSTFGSASVIQNEPYKLTVPTKTGYDFIGWFDSASGGKQYTDGTGISLAVWDISGGKTLYAHWRLNYYSITYICNEFVKLKGLPSVYSVEDNNISLSSQERNYYNFRWEIDGQTVSLINTSYAKDIVVNGVWTPFEYKITYVLNDGTASNRTSYNVETQTFKLTEPTKTGYTFVGWTGSNGDIPQKDVTISVGSHADLSYTANWRINHYTISFNSNGGSSVASITQDYNTPVNAPDDPSLAKKSFVGWFDSSLSNEYQFTVMPAENITLYAKWVDYQVTLSADEKEYITVADELSPEFFNAEAIDSDGNAVPIRIETIQGQKRVGETLSITLVAEGKYGVVERKQLSILVADTVFIVSGNTIIGLTSYGKTLESIIVPNIIDGKEIIGIGNGAFGHCPNLTSIEISSGVEKIGDFALIACYNLISVSIPDSVTEVGTGVLYGCSKLERIDLGTVCLAIWNYFQREENPVFRVSVPSSLKTIVITGGTSIPVGFFNYCYSATSISIPDTTITINRGAFYGCSSLVDIIIPDSVKSIEDEAFYGCSSLTHLVIPNSVTHIGRGVLSFCSKLESLSVPFLGECAEPKYGGLSNAVLGYYFKEICFGLNTDYINTCSYSFVNKKAPIPSTSGWGEERDGCSLTWQYSCYSGQLSFDEPILYSLCSFYYYIPVSLKHVIITGTTVSDYAFFNCTGLETVTLSDTVTTIGIWAFQNCSATIIQGTT